MILSVYKFITGWFASIVEWIETNSDFVSATATIAIAAFTLTLWWATRKLWRASQEQSMDMKSSLAIAKESADAANRSAQLAEDALISGKRAFVFVKETISNRVSSKDGIDNWDITIVWKNTGDTPTKNMLCSANSKGFKGNIPTDFNLPDSSKYPFLRAVIGPGGEIIHTITIPLPHLYINSPPPDRVYVWGWAEYNDVFKDTQRHRTEFCFEIEQIGIGNRTTLSFNLYAKYNGADDECYHKPSPYTPPT